MTLWRPYLTVTNKGRPMQTYPLPGWRDGWLVDNFSLFLPKPRHRDDK